MHVSYETSARTRRASSHARLKRSVRPHKLESTLKEQPSSVGSQTVSPARRCVSSAFGFDYRWPPRCPFWVRVLPFPQFERLGAIAVTRITSSGWLRVEWPL